MDKLHRIIEWTKLIVRIESNGLRDVYFYEREIWWVNIGSNIGFEQDGKNSNFERPVLVLKKFGRHSFLGVPMSSKKKEGIYYYSVIHEEKDYSILLSQIKLMSSKRLIRKLRTIAENEFKECIERFKSLL